MDEYSRMTRLAFYIALVAGLGAAIFWYVQNAQNPQQAIAPAPELDLAEGELLYAGNCAACHGANLEGQENWQEPSSDGRLPAPPHDATGHTWHHGDQLLFDYTKLGGNVVMAAQGVEFDSGMPGFGDTLTDAQIWNILAYIQSTWPERIQEMQATRTESEQLRGN